MPRTLPTILACLAFVSWTGQSWGVDRTFVIAGSGTLVTGESFVLQATNANGGSGLLRYQAAPEMEARLVTLDCVRVSWILLPPSRTFTIALSGTDETGTRHAAVFLDIGPGTLAADHGRFMEPGDDSCGVTYGALHRIDGAVETVG